MYIYIYIYQIISNHHFHPFPTSLTTSLRWQEALQLLRPVGFAAAKQRSWVNRVISCCGRSKAWRTALQLLGEMRLGRMRSMG